jgi:hypothetical protein
MQTSSFTICGRHFSFEEIQLIQNFIVQQPNITRAALSRQVCDLFSWIRPDGRRKDMSCRVALIKLDRQGLIKLPKPTKQIVRKAKNQNAPISDQTVILKPVEQIRDLNLLPVNASSPKQSKLWNELVDHYHYLGYKPLVGAQFRYLISSEDGWLGAISFSAAAWKIEPRDKYIGWSSQIRKANLPYVVCNSRFLILPWVKSKNLASKVLSLSAKRITKDWFENYGFQPVLLETFVDKERFLGTCYKAANWRYVGQTKGRGKLDRHHKYAVPIKDIYLYPLRKDFRSLLCRMKGVN